MRHVLQRIADFGSNSLTGPFRRAALWNVSGGAEQESHALGHYSPACTRGQRLVEAGSVRTLRPRYGAGRLAGGDGGLEANRDNKSSWAKANA